LNLELQPNSPAILTKLPTNEINFSEFVTVKFDTMMNLFGSATEWLLHL